MPWCLAGVVCPDASVFPLMVMLSVWEIHLHPGEMKDMSRKRKHENIKYLEGESN